MLRVDLCRFARGFVVKGFDVAFDERAVLVERTLHQDVAEESARPPEDRHQPRRQLGHEAGPDLRRGLVEAAEVDADQPVDAAAVR